MVDFLLTSWAPEDLPSHRFGGTGTHLSRSDVTRYPRRISSSKTATQKVGVKGVRKVRRVAPTFTVEITGLLCGGSWDGFVVEVDARGGRSEGMVCG